MRYSIVTTLFCAFFALSLTACEDDATTDASSETDVEATPGVPSTTPSNDEASEETEFPEAASSNERDKINGDESSESAEEESGEEETEEELTGQCETSADCITGSLPACTTMECLNKVCVALPGNDGFPCDDGNVCTENTICNLAEGGCVGGQDKDCDDGNPCTIDSCGAPDGCTHADAEGECDDGDLCTMDDTCAMGICVGGEETVCDDDDPCTVNNCNPDTGDCDVSFEENGTDCDDGNECTTAVCENGSCVGTAIEDGTVCDDGTGCSLLGECTEGTCIPGDPAKDGTPCDDGDACTFDDSCKSGVCIPGAVKDEEGCDGAGEEGGTGGGTGGGAGGECDGLCGGSSLSGCYCDSTCFSFGDCCTGICEDCPSLPECSGGTGGCGFGEIEGCGGDCVDVTWLGDGICDTSLNCESLGYDNGDCDGGGGLGSCEGICGGYAGDCYCDSTCQEFGDCCSDYEQFCGSGVVCGPGQIKDCNSNCVDESLLGDGFCNDWLDPVADFDCAALQSDNGDCCLDTFSESVLDCDGTCTIKSYLNDGYCDSALDCAKFNFDEGDCGSGGTEGGEGGTGDCVNTNNGALDNFGDSCEYYENLELFCGNYDDDDFTASEMCCACGGGDSSGAEGGTSNCEDVTIGVNNDGCCPPGYNSVSDSDCSCDATQLQGCAGFETCIDTTALGNGTCDEELNCEANFYDNGDCDEPTEGGEECGEGQALDCDGVCNDKSAIGDGICDDAGPSAFMGVDFNCAEFDFDGGDCEEVETQCPEGEVPSCSGATCWDASKVGDGTCDEYLDCEIHNFDGGDCSGTGEGGSGGECFAPLVADCDGSCESTVWLGNGTCHEGLGDDANFNCFKYNYDEGDCVDSEEGGTAGGGVEECGAGEILDCDDNCRDQSNIGDGFCHDGSIFTNFNCAEFQYDGGDCLEID